MLLLSSHIFDKRIINNIPEHQIISTIHSTNKISSTAMSKKKQFFTLILLKSILDTLKLFPALCKIYSKFFFFPFWPPTLKRNTTYQGERNKWNPIL